MHRYKLRTSHGNYNEFDTSKDRLDHEYIAETDIRDMLQSQRYETIGVKPTTSRNLNSIYGTSMTGERQIKSKLENRLKIKLKALEDRMVDDELSKVNRITERSKMIRS